MIKEQLENNENVKTNTKLLNQLKENFPDFFDKDNNFKIDKFKNALKSDEINITKEGYELNFLGKSYARFQTSTETETIISPLTDHNNDDENKDSENLYIIGDNLDALKHLLKSYSRKVKCIYIDPPYNTGSDGFVYPDNFKFDSTTLSNKMGIDEEEAERIIDMRGKSTHSAWLTFMYPRLVLARELLSDDGVIFISIDDNEQANLKIICDEIFGEENFISEFVWKKKQGGGNDSSLVVTEHEYINAYCKNIADTSFFLDKKYSLDPKLYPLNDENGDYGLITLDKSSLGYVESLDFEIKDPEGNSYFPRNKDNEKKYRWRWSKEKVNSDYDKLIFKNGKVYTKYYKPKGVTPRSLLIDSVYGRTETGNDDLKNLFNISTFSYPKPIDLINHFISISTPQQSIVLDFFSGSATTAHAVMKLNAEDGGNRKYILVQIPEEIEESKPAFKAGYKTIDEIGRERIKRAAQKIKEETNADIDYGFKVVKLENVQENTLERLESFDPNVLVSDDYVNDFSNEDSSGLETILTTWLNQDGYGLHAKWEDFKLVNYIAHRYSNSLYIVNEGIESSDISRLIEMIENNELNISRIVIYTYSLPFTIINELKTNIKNLRNNKTVDIIERY
ncbi:MAG: DNA methyltransferase [Gemella haemolysans]|uniref:site-specific DNA-methyltransferase n=1 Tax=Gemella haemolysans TaxID=1379 RepID=UPI003F9F0E91